jgi:hypothetical protein
MVNIDYEVPCDSQTKLKRKMKVAKLFFKKSSMVENLFSVKFSSIEFLAGKKSIRFVNISYHKTDFQLQFSISKQQ